MKRELTHDQKIALTKCLISIYEKKSRLYMCNYINAYCEIYFNFSLSENPLKYLFPEFLEHKPFNIEPYCIWFPIGDYKSRLKYCKKILDIIEKKTGC